MSSAESSRKLRHFGLLSQQKRVRHIESISLKNLSTDRALLEDDAPENVYFVLLKPGDVTEFYSSESVQDIVNPSWNNLDLGNSCKAHYDSLLCIIVQIWGSNANGRRILVEWKVHLRGLIHVREELAKDSKKFQPDSIVFGLMDSFYTAADCLPVSAIGNDAKFCHALEVEQTMVSATYDVYSIARLHTMQRAIKQSEASFSGAQKSIMGRLTSQEEQTNLKAENEYVVFRIFLLQEELTKQKLELKEDQRKCSEFREKHLQQKSESMKKLDQLRNSQRRLQDHLESLSSIRDNHSEVKGDYYTRRSTLIKELAAIYPIDEVPKDGYYINGVKLPNAENYAGYDDTQIAIALGHTCQLVLMIAKFLQMPLRYPMVHLGSRSIIRDHITAHLSQKDRDFPLYSKGREKMHFNYAVYLLNRNIVQVRTAVKLNTSELRATLPNLKDLLEQKWGVRRPSEPSLTNSPETSRAISNHNLMHVPSPLATRPLPPNPPQYTETQIDPSFPRSPPPPYEANFTQQQVSGLIPDVNVNTVVVEASMSGAATNAQREAGFPSLNKEEEEDGERSEVEGHDERTEVNINNEDSTDVVSCSNRAKKEAKESAIEHNDRDGETNGYHSNGDRNSTKVIEGESIPGCDGATAQPINHTIEHSASIQSHSHPKSTDHSRNDKIHKVLNNPLEDESYHENFSDEVVDLSESALSEAGFSQFADDINSRTEALSNRGRFSSFNKAQNDMTS